MNWDILKNLEMNQDILENYILYIIDEDILKN